MPGPVAALLPGDRLHLQHGPIDLVIGADGDRHAAFAAASTRFGTILEELVAELPLLRSYRGKQPDGVVARQMQAAVAPHAAKRFVTPMAAVAGAVADAVLEAMVRSARLSRAYVNNGGDIALYLTAGSRFRMTVAGADGNGLGRIEIAAGDPVRGVATSGQGGRSLSMGIAESVTVLARSAAEADAAATLIANAVDLPGHPAIRRTTATEVDPDSDLGGRCVVTHVGALSADEVARALEAGLAAAHHMQALGLIAGAALWLRGQARSLGEPATVSLREGKITEHA